jgi:hypothetical protein
MILWSFEKGHLGFDMSSGLSLLYISMFSFYLLHARCPCGVSSATGGSVKLYVRGISENLVGLRVR